MNFQTVLVLLIILSATVYVGRRVFLKLRAFSSDSGGSCETGCGKCGSGESKSRDFARIKQG